MLFSQNSGKNQTMRRSSDAQKVLVAIDIGSSMIRLIAGEVLDDGQVKVLFYRETKSAGISNGAVSDLAALSNRLSTLVQVFESEFGVNLSHCILGIAGRHIESKNASGAATVQNKIVSLYDRDKAIENARSVRLTDGHHIIHVIPQFYTVENTSDITNPIGLSAMRLDVKVHIISCSRDQENNFRSAIAKISPNVLIDHVVYNGIAASDAVLTEGEKEIGVGLIDFGGGTVNVTVYDRKRMVFSFGLERGGFEITRRIATYFALPLSVAEQLKNEYGVAFPRMLSPEDKKRRFKITLNNSEEGEECIVSKLELADLIYQGLEDIFYSIRDRIESLSRKNGMVLSLGAGFVLTGGMAKTKGIEELAAYRLAPDSNSVVKVKIGKARGVTGFKEEPIGPDKSVCVGMLRFGKSVMNERNYETERAEQTGVKSVFGKIKDWFSREL